MNNSIRNGLRTGATISVVTVFLMLTGFLVTSSAMIGQILRNVQGATAAVNIPVLNLALSVGLLGFFGGVFAARSLNNDRFKDLLIAGLSTGVLSGLVVAACSYLIGSLNNNGVDLRGYLPQVSPEAINLFNFRQQNLLTAGAYHFLLLTGTALLGGLSTKGFGAVPLGSTVKNRAAKLSESLTGLPFIKQFLAYKYAPQIGFALLIIVVFILPRIWGPYWNFIMGTVGIYILLGLGLNIIVGLSGQLVLGYVAFFAIGAYTFGLITAPEPHQIMLTFWQALPIAVLVSAFTGILLGLPILNLRGDYLAIVTLGFGEIIRILLKSDMLGSFTNGPRGIRNIAQPILFGKPFTSDVQFMDLILAAVVVGIFIAYRLQNSRTGRAWLAVRNDQTVAQATGVNNFYYKILALALGAGFAGLSGALFASRSQFTGPEDHILMVSINVLCLVIVGGMGSLPGVVVGALVLKGLPEILRDLEIYRMLVFGALLVGMMIIRPEGIWPTGRPKLEPPKENPEAPATDAAVSEGEV